MKIGKLELGIWKCAKTLTFKEKWFVLEYNHGSCGCYIFTISAFYITWLSEECK